VGRVSQGIHIRLNRIIGWIVTQCSVDIATVGIFEQPICMWFALVRFEKINMVVLGLLAQPVLRWKQILIAHSPAVPDIKGLVFDNPPLGGTSTHNKNDQKT
jgi:hypothetical protein